MASTIVFQVAATAPHKSDTSGVKLRSSLFKTSNVSLFDKRAQTTTLAFNLKTTRGGVNRQIVCTANSFYGTAKRVPVTPLSLEEATRPPTNLYTAEAPHTATFLSIEKITGPKATQETYHIVFDHGGFFPHWEGQVFGVIPPPANPFEPGDAKRLSYFSGSSSRYGDYFNGRTASLTVGLVPGTTSEFLAKSKVGDKLQVTGPTREALLLGDHNNPRGNHIFVATGTGVAPFRAHLRRFFKEDIPTFRYSGLTWLFHGVTNPDSQLYGEEFNQYLKDYPENFRYNLAFSEEQKKYVQDIFAEHAKEVFDLLLKGAYIYIAGRKEPVVPIENALKNVAESEGLNWESVFATFKRNNQWRVEVY